MMRCIITFYKEAIKSIMESSGETKITWSLIYNQLKPQFIRLTQMKFEDPKQSLSDFNEYFASLCDDIVSGFRKLNEANLIK